MTIPKQFETEFEYFGELNPGDTFIYENSVWLKIDHAHPKAEIFTPNEDFAVELSTGKLKAICRVTKVIPQEFEAVLSFRG